MKIGDRVRSTKRITLYHNMTFEPRYIEKNTEGIVKEVRDTKFGKVMGVTYEFCDTTMVHWLNGTDDSFIHITDAT